MNRLPENATTVEEVVQYYITRDKQFRHDNVSWSGVISEVDKPRSGIFRTEFTMLGEQYASYYALVRARGENRMVDIMRGDSLPIITTTSCNIKKFLYNNKIPYESVADFMLDSIEYKLISEFYASRTTRRSKVFLMNHIDEGLAIMARNGSSKIAMRAYCLHPLLQNDEDLKINFTNVINLVTCDDAQVVLGLAMEYRNVANAYLSNVSMPPTGIRLSPISAVNEMLVADKVQNKKDFDLYHKHRHPNSERLVEYFDEWLVALGVSDRYKELHDSVRETNVVLIRI